MKMKNSGTTSQMTTTMSIKNVIYKVMYMVREGTTAAAGSLSSIYKVNILY